MAESQAFRGISWTRVARPAAFIIGVSLALAAGLAPAKADKVGVAAAVEPDAFSSLDGTPDKQLNIGKSIFYNERIATTTSGLVQVLLIDGSTFTVGPNSDLVIDKFVYDPNKKTGELVATFSKGTMRFIGGKLSKNEGGVKVNTPAGALAIRGGMVQGRVSGSHGVFSFLYGVQMSFTGRNGHTQTVYEPGYTLDLSSGTPKIRPTTPQDTNFFMSALSPGNTTNTNSTTTPTTPTQNQFQLSTNYSQVINEATTTQIQDELQKQIANRYSPPSNPTSNEPTTTPGTPVQTATFGYASGVYLKHSGPFFERAGTLTNFSPTEVGVLFNDDAFAGAKFDLYANLGRHGSGGAQITFAPANVVVDLSPDGADQLPASGLFLGLASHDLSPDSILAFNDTTYFPPQHADKTTVNSGIAALFGTTGASGVLCDACDFLKWGLWVTEANFEDSAGQSNQTRSTGITIAGWWVTGNIPTVGDLPEQGFATYDGHTIGNVAALVHSQQGGWGWDTHTANGDVHMNWDFARRSGGLSIRNFDADGPYGALNAWGRMKMPGVLENPNQFAGRLVGGVGRLPVSGFATGSFVSNGADNAAAAIGNWNAGNPIYKASGVFGASRTGPISANPLGVD